MPFPSELGICSWEYRTEQLVAEHTGAGLVLTERMSKLMECGVDRWPTGDSNGAGKLIPAAALSAIRLEYHLDRYAEVGFEHGDKNLNS